MDRSRKKSSLQQLEDKQMKRYHRSKKRSQKREKIDIEPELDEKSKKEKEYKVKPNTKPIKSLVKKETSLVNYNLSESKDKQKVKEIHVMNKTEYLDAEIKNKNKLFVQQNKENSNVNVKSTEIDSNKYLIKDVAPTTSEKTEQGREIKEINREEKDSEHAKKELGIDSEHKVGTQKESGAIIQINTYFGSGYSTRLMPVAKELSHKNHEISTNDVESASRLKYLYLDSTNIWLDKYKYDDAEKQFHHLKKDSSESESALLVMDNVNVDQNDSIKPKPKVTYEIIEEIIETTEITYTLVIRDTKDAHVEEEMKRFESQSSEFTEYLTDLGKYVNSLERRVNTLEGGKKKKLGSERSPSLSSSESDEGVDLTGKNNGYPFNNQLNMREQDLSILPRMKTTPLVY